MKLNSIHYGDAEEVTAVAVTMTLDEAAFLTRLTGTMSDNAIHEGIGGDARWPEAMHGIYYVLAGVMNREYDGGVNDVIPRARGKLQWVREDS